TILMGASFPLISSLAVTQENQEGGTIGIVYFFNVLGNVTGSLLTAFVMLPIIGTEASMLILSIIGFAFGLLPIFRASKPKRIIGCISIAVCIACSWLFFPERGMVYQVIHTHPAITKIKTDLFGMGHAESLSISQINQVYGHFRELKSEQPEKLDKDYRLNFEEGVEGIVLTWETPNQLLNYIDGLNHGAAPGYDFYAEVLETIACTEQTKNVLIIGFGIGNNHDLVLRSDELEQVTVIELNQSLIINLQKIPRLKKQLSDPRSKLIIDDGRQFLLQTEQKFDLILADPLRSATAYSNNLYSQNFFDLVSQRLAPNGIFFVWMDEHQVIPRTLASVFPHIRKYEGFAVASNSQIRRNPHRRDKLLESFSLTEQEKIDQFSSRYLGDQDWILESTSNWPINVDNKPRSEYYLGLTGQAQNQ
ncbi:MAG: hypothetical protein AAGA30_18130, partial [Planctomycetota bacterium]